MHICSTVLNTSNTGYSKIKVSFDIDGRFPPDSSILSNNDKHGMSSPYVNSNSASSMGFLSPNPQQYIGTPNYNTGNRDPFIGEISETFWVQNHHIEPPTWCEPEELFVMEVKKIISITDKRVFWEMVKAVIELPQLASHCKSGIRTQQEIAAVLKRAENRVLWTAEAPFLLPSQITSELITAAYVPPDKELNRKD